MVSFRAGAASMAGIVLVVPLFGRLTISRRGLYSRGGVAPTWWCSIGVNVVHACSSKRPAAHVSLSWNFLWLLTSCLPDSFHSEPSVYTSFVLLCHGWHGKQKSVTVQCKARWYYKSPSRQQKNEGRKNFSVLRVERPSLHASKHCLRQWPYHSKIPHAGAELTVD